MTHDPLDELLDGTAPPTRAPREADVVAMIADARAQARTRRPRHRRALTAATVTVLLVGGAGVAAATDGFSWTPQMQQPLGAVEFTMANGYDCELRFSEIIANPDFSEYIGPGPEPTADPAFVAEVNRALAAWYADADVIAEARALVPEERREIAATTDAAASELDMSGLSPEEQNRVIERMAFEDEWYAWDRAVRKAEVQALAQVGIDVRDGSPGDSRLAGSGRYSGIQCRDDDGEVYEPWKDQ